MPGGHAGLRRALAQGVDWLVAADRGLLPVVMYEPRISALFIGKPDDGLNGPADVRGKSLGFANPTSLVAMFGQQWLRQQGLEPGKDYQVRGARTDMGVGRMLLTGEVGAMRFSVANACKDLDYYNTMAADADAQRAIATEQHDRQPGYVACMLPTGPNIHRMRNLGTEDAISIHIYGFDHEAHDSSIETQYTAVEG